MMKTAAQFISSGLPISRALQHLKIGTCVFNKGPTSQLTFYSIMRAKIHVKLTLRDFFFVTDMAFILINFENISWCVYYN